MYKETGIERLGKYSTISLGVILVMSLVLVQPLQALAEEIRIELTPRLHEDVTSGDISGQTIPEFECGFLIDFDLDDHTSKLTRLAGEPTIYPDGISQNTVRNGNIIKTVHAEKEVYGCFLNQGDIPVIVERTIIAEIYEDIGTKSIIQKQALVLTCIKDEDTATVIDCESEPVPTDVVPTGSDCFEEISTTHPQEMNSVNKGKIVKTIESQKEVFVCALPDLARHNTGGAVKKVDVVTFTDIWEDLGILPDNPIVKKEFLVFRCVTVIGSNLGTDDQVVPASVESCQFSTIQD